MTCTGTWWVYIKHQFSLVHPLVQSPLHPSNYSYFSKSERNDVLIGPYWICFAKIWKLFNPIALAHISSFMIAFVHTSNPPTSTIKQASSDISSSSTCKVGTPFQWMICSSNGFILSFDGFASTLISKCVLLTAPKTNKTNRNALHAFSLIDTLACVTNKRAGQAINGKLFWYQSVP